MVKQHVYIVVDGIPVAKGRARMTRQGHAFTPAKTRQYEDVLRLAAAQAMGDRPPLDCAVEVLVRVDLPIPKSMSKKKKELAMAGELLPTTRPDVDNYMKSALDGINSIVIRDDALVVYAKVSKRYSEKPRLTIEVFEW